MHPRLLHLRQLHDGARQLSLKGALVIEFLHEFRHPEVFTIENLEAHPTTLRQPFRRQGKPQLINLVGGDENRLAVGGDLIRNLLLFEFFYDFTGVIGAQVGEKRFIINLVRQGDQDPESHEGEKNNSSHRPTSDSG